MNGAAALGASRAARNGALAWLTRNPVLVCLGAAVAASGALLIVLGSHLTVYADEWNIVLLRQGVTAGPFLDPYNGHLIVGVIVVYKVLLATFGMASPLPFHVVSTIVYVLAAVLLFGYMRSRVGEWLALFGSGVILFLGAANEDLLFPFQIFFSGAIAAGLGALLALDRDDRRWDLAACALLVVSTSFSEVGIAFSLGALVRVALAERPWRGRVYIALVPLGLYGLWWLGWGHTAASDITLHNAAGTPSYVVDAAAAGVAALLGLASASDQPGGAVGQQWMPVALAAALVLALWRVLRIGRIPRGVWPALVIGVTFWALAGLSYIPGRGAATNRYLYPSAVFCLLIAAELLRGVRPGARAIVATAAVAALAIAANLAFLSDGYKLFWKPQSQLIRADLAALEIGGPVNPSFVLTREVSPAPYFDIAAGSYLSAAQTWGSPAYTQSELPAAPESSRVEADKVLGAILGLRLTRVGAVHRACQSRRAALAAGTEVSLDPGRVSVHAGATGAQVAMGRFADGLSVVAGTVPPRSTRTLSIPHDGSARPWRLGIRGPGRITLCGSALTGGGSA